MYSSDLRKSIEMVFQILDGDLDGFLTLNEIENVLLKASYWNQPSQEVFEKNAKNDAKKLMVKLDPENKGKVSRESFINYMLHDPDFINFRETFEFKLKYGNLYTAEPTFGKNYSHLE